MAFSNTCSTEEKEIGLSLGGNWMRARAVESGINQNHTENMACFYVIPI